MEMALQGIILVPRPEMVWKVLLIRIVVFTFGLLLERWWYDVSNGGVVEEMGGEGGSAGRDGNHRAEHSHLDGRRDHLLPGERLKKVLPPIPSRKVFPRLPG